MVNSSMIFALYNEMLDLLIIHNKLGILII